MEYIKGQLLKVTNVLYPLILNFSDLHPIFRKTPADCGDKVENRPLLRKQNKRASEKFRYQVWSSAAVAAAIGLDPSKGRLDDGIFVF